MSDGKPCFSLNEKLWRKFSSKEGMEEEHLICELEIFNNLSDERYKYNGNITYKKIYEDNLSEMNQDFLLKEIKGNETVSLYTREFLGINKSCDEKYNLSKDDYDKITKTQKREKHLIIAEFVIIMLFMLTGYFPFIVCCYDNGDYFQIYLPILMSILLIFIICKSVFLGIIIHYDLSYNCSDAITNEVFRKENENTKYSIIFISINLGLEIFIVLFNSISILLFPYIKKYEKQKEKSFNRDNRRDNDIIRYNNVNNNNINNNNRNNTNRNYNNNLPRNNFQFERVNNENIRRIIIQNRHIMDSQSSKGSTNDNTSYFSD